MIAESFAAVLAAEQDLEVVGVTRRALDAPGLAQRLAVDVVLLDFRLPDGEAPDVIPMIAMARPEARVIVVSAASDYRSVIRALEAGAAGYLLKDQDLQDLVAAVRVVRSGGQALAPSLVPALVSRIAETPGSSQRLTRREIEVLQHLAFGRSTRELADELGLSVNTVRNHVQSAINRLGAHSKLEAVALAIRQGLIRSPESLAPSTP